MLLAAVAACAFGALTVGSASGALMKAGTSNLLAIYGNPGANGAEIPVGGGLGRNFGFGENMLFEASSITTPAIGKNLKIKLAGKTAEARESFVGGTLLSNKTGEGNALSFAVQFADFQDNVVTEALTPSYADTYDRPWIAEICPLNEGKKECRIDPSLTEVAAAGRTVKIEDVSFDLSGTVVQGTVWGKWKPGKPSCIALENKPAGAGADQTLIGTQPAAVVGLAIEAIEGEPCMESANNDVYVGHVEEVTIKNE
ncbi:MAG TPA: hypothetical protein VNY31_06935 [Solirubrobacteraceae bacterium]|nr:hypothetical protein [Solirubrobacteraceae bacterium]